VSGAGNAPLGVAIVGCGIIGVNHARAIARHPDLAIVALVDAVPVAATALADLVSGELGLERPREHASLEAALTSGEIDLVVICTPSGLHVHLAEEAVAAGANVVIEKPLDVSLPRARRIAELARDAASRGIVVSVISQHRFDPASVVVAAAAWSGKFGRVTSAVASVAWWRDQAYYDSGTWRGTWALDGGGAVMNQGVHTVDLLVWFLGTPVEVSAQTALLAHERVEIEDVAVAIIRFASGALATLHATTAAYPGLSARIQVFGSTGSASIDDDRLEYFHAAGGAAGNQAANLVPPSELKGAPPTDGAFVTGHLRQYDDVASAIRSGTAPGVTVDDALLSLAVVRAIYLSATLHRPVAMTDVLDGSLDDVEVVVSR
jgi:predicted dehydrogenase